MISDRQGVLYAVQIMAKRRRERMLKRKMILGKAKKALALTLTSAMIASLSPSFVGGGTEGAGC